MDKKTDAAFLDNFLSYLLARAGHLVSEDFGQTLKKAGLDRAGWRILASLNDFGEVTIGELAKTVLMKQPTLTKALDRMEKEKLVKRHHSKTDRRAIIIRITAGGRKEVSKLLVQAKQHEKDVLKSYSKKEEEVLKHVLRTLINRME